MPSYNCSHCGKTLEEIGVPPQIQMVQLYQQVVNIGSEAVPEEIKKDPFLYRGFFCPACKKAFCPTCCHMQGEICPECNQRKLMPAYRPLLKTAEADTAAPAVPKGGGAIIEPKPSSPLKAGPESGCCPYCGAFLLDEKGQIRIWLEISKKNPGAQGIFCVECREEFDSGQLAALRQAHKSMPPEKLAALQAADKSATIKAPEPAKKGPCFVATAAFGSALQPEVEFLQRFRDERLSKHAAGMLAIRVYNSVGPPLAGLVRRSQVCQRIARGAIRRACAFLRRVVL
jgi:hypothetical protein